MALRINDEAPNFAAETTVGSINFHEWIGDGWAILFSHPKDFTPVCTTEFGYVAKINSELEKRNVKVIGLSVDSVDDHESWSKDIEETQGHAVNYPLIEHIVIPADSHKPGEPFSDPAEAVDEVLII